MKKSPGPTHPAWLPKALYGAFFCLILPAYLMFWADQGIAMETPKVEALPWPGLVLIMAGVAFMIAGVTGLAIHGRGLPMIAFPPPNYVRSGAFGLTPHPIYLGFCLSCFGASLAIGSNVGLWVVSPIVALSCAALVWGFERQDLKRRFGDAVTLPWLRLPAAQDTRATGQDAVSVTILVFLPWMILYGAVEYIGAVPPFASSVLSFEAGRTVIELAEIPYVLTYPFVALAPFFAGTRRSLRKFAVAGALATAVVIPFYLTLPTVAPFVPFEPQTIWGDLILFEQSFDSPATAFPAFHVIWAFLAARLYGQRFPKARILIWAAAWLIALGSYATGMHAALDIAGGLVVYAGVRSYGRIWSGLKGVTEIVANSWREWRFGPVRIINHGLYAGAAGGVGFVITSFLVGSNHLWSTTVVMISILVIAGLWAQVVEGSDKLLRPFGFYGGVFGAIVGVLTACLLFPELGPWSLGAALCVAAPWMQAIGRLRCLVQGCCHGASAPAHIGIHYHRAQSRVCRIANLKGHPIHPTPLYSILGNIVVGAVMYRFVAIGVPTSVMVGSYLMLSSLCRFVEEGYRGEPQTPVAGGLTLYQWLCIGGLFAGSFVTMFDAGALDLANADVAPATWLIAVGTTLLAGFAMGVDFPGSNRRFSRLT